MSKRLGNAVDPFATLDKYGADALRWYMVTNAQPWDNLKFDEDGIVEVQRKFFGTLYNTYSFFALYANIDGFKFSENYIKVDERPEIDRWIISELNTLIESVKAAYEDYEPTKAGRLIQEFVTDYLSNWYVRLCRRRFWKGEYTEDKISAYQTLYECLEKIAIMSSPIAPFFMDRLFTDLNGITKAIDVESVHLALFPAANGAHINNLLEQKMQLAQQVTSMVLSLRKKEQIKVRQPLQKIMIPVLNTAFAERLEAVKSLVLSEVNVKELEFMSGDSGILVKNIKANFKLLGKRFGSQMKAVAEAVTSLSQDDIRNAEQQNEVKIMLDGEAVSLTLEEVEISTQDIPGWLVTTENGITVALDITISEELRQEGIAREFVNRIQNLRKDSGLDVTDKIALQIRKHDFFNAAIENNLDYICAETLAASLDLVEQMQSGSGIQVEIEEGITTELSISKF